MLIRRLSGCCRQSSLPSHFSSRSICLAAWQPIFCSRRPGESTTDLVWDGHALIYENGQVQPKPLVSPYHPPSSSATLMLEGLTQERLRSNIFAESTLLLSAHNSAFAPFAAKSRSLKEISCCRPLPRFPYVPESTAERSKLCAEAFNIQVHGLIKRLQATGIKKLFLVFPGLRFHPCPAGGR